MKRCATTAGATGRRRHVDAVVLVLHGAMIAHGYDDCEGDLLARVRATGGAEGSGRRAARPARQSDADDDRPAALS
jgi:hypothetical protein